MASCSNYLTPTKLAERWGVHTATLKRWRDKGEGPGYFKTPASVLYPLAEVEQYEQANTITHNEQ